jgi:hypothetical protein
MAWRGSRARGVFRAPACIAFSSERHRLRSPVAPVRQALVGMLTWPIISGGKSKRLTFTATAETYVGPVDYAAPKTVREARTLILELGERLAKREIPVELHDSLITGIKAYLADQTAEHEKRLAALENALRYGESS